MDTVHTNGGSGAKFKLGIFFPVGHSNFYINGGSTQPGCRISFAFAAKAWIQLMKGKKPDLTSKNTSSLLESELQLNP